MKAAENSYVNIFDHLKKKEAFFFITFCIIHDNHSHLGGNSEKNTVNWLLKCVYKIENISD